MFIKTEFYSQRRNPRRFPDCPCLYGKVGPFNPHSPDNLRGWHNEAGQGGQRNEQLADQRG